MQAKTLDSYDVIGGEEPLLPLPASSSQEVLERWRKAIELLLSTPPSQPTNVLVMGGLALSTLLAYRYAGVALLCGDGTVRVEAVWNNGRNMGSCSYPLSGTPCDTVYDGDSAACFYRDVAHLFPDDEMLSDLGAYLFRGHRMIDSSGACIGHVFAMHDQEEDPAVDADAMMQLIARWCVREIQYNRLVADLKASETRALEALQMAEAAERERLSFLANVSHEVRTPLNAVIGFGELLQLDGVASCARQVMGYGRNIADSGRHLLGLIEGLLDLSRIENGHPQLRFEAVDPRSAIESAVIMVRSQAQNRGLRVMVLVEGDMPPIYGDARAVRQILVNLLANAVKYAKTADMVCVRANTQPCGKQVELKVSDNGVGIPASALERVMQPFERGGDAWSGSDGVGLGLPISKQLTEAMDGAFDISSDENRGTCVMVRLPVAE